MAKPIVLNAACALTLSDVDAATGPDRRDFVYVFDFDGVLAGPVEDAVYRLPGGTPGDEMLALAGAAFGLDASLYDLPYLRHLVLQEILQARGRSIDAGPLMAAARDLSHGGGSVFVLTARSGLAAVARAAAFLSAQSIMPQELFCVGRVGKGRQIALLARQMPDRQLVFFDDSAAHIERAQKMSATDVIPVHVLNDPDATAVAAADLYQDCVAWLADHLAGSRRRAA